MQGKNRESSDSVVRRILDDSGLSLSLFNSMAKISSFHSKELS
jgi:hypothetical protein